jgi:hypothetical protein
MTQAPLDPATAPAGTTGPGGETHERDWAVLELEVLHDLARIGTAIAERLNQQHAAAVAATPPGAARAALHRDIALAFMRIARAVRLTLAMFGRVQEALEALAASAVLPTAPAMPVPLVVPQRPPPSAGAGLCAAAETARALAPDLDDLDRDLEAEGDKRDDENRADGPDPAKRAHGSNRPDRESLTEFADFGFSLKSCGPGEVIARIYRDLGLPPDPARWPQAWPAEAGGNPGGAAARKVSPEPQPQALDALGPEAGPGTPTLSRSEPAGDPSVGNPLLPHRDKAAGWPLRPGQRRGPPEDSS